jgi:hypothetical protein
MSHPFLSAEWMAAAREIRARYDGEVADTTQVVRINQIITDVPFGDGVIESYLDTSSGRMAMELGQLDEPDATITTDYSTAKSIFVDQDPAAGMQAFMAGKIRVQGDMMKLMAMQASVPQDEVALRIAEEIKAITEA